jgi:hypothetical protein
MKTRLAVVIAILLSLGIAGYAHRLDEYLQASLITIERDHVTVLLRLVPGVAVSPEIINNIDSNGDGRVSGAEARAYAQRVLGDLTLSLDGHHLVPRLESVNFPQVEQIKAGLGEIQIQFSASLPAGAGNRTLMIENHHKPRISAYLANCLVPGDRNIRVLAQTRNENQSFYRLEYAQDGGRAGLNLTALAGRLGGFPSMFRLGVRHIAEGTDHLLFLLALLLPAPLLIKRSRWGGFAGTRRSLSQILKVVTAFTIGHSITLALAAFGVVHLPSRPIEVLIAVSILVSAVHALRPVFPGREAVIAGFFGLIHGLAFAATLEQLGVGRWERLAGIAGFNLGIEAMQLIVVAATMPSLLLLSRARAYSLLRVGGACFAGLAAMGWIAERLLGLHNSFDVIVGGLAHRAGWIAAALLIASLICWFYSEAKRTVFRSTA